MYFSTSILFIESHLTTYLKDKEQPSDLMKSIFESTIKCKCDRLFFNIK